MQSAADKFRVFPHDKEALAVHAMYPAGWAYQEEEAAGGDITTDQAVSAANDYYIKGLLSIPLKDEPFTIIELGVWMSVSQDSFFDMCDKWYTPGRESNSPLYFSWLRTELQTVWGESTLNLKALLHTQPVGIRPIVELEPTRHPLATAQHEGVSREEAYHLQSLLVKAMSKL